MASSPASSKISFSQQEAATVTSTEATVISRLDNKQAEEEIRNSDVAPPCDETDNQRQQAIINKLQADLDGVTKASLAKDIPIAKLKDQVQRLTMYVTETVAAKDQIIESLNNQVAVLESLNRKLAKSPYNKK